MGQQHIERDRKTFRDLAELASSPSLQRASQSHAPRGGSISEIRHKGDPRDRRDERDSDSGLINLAMLAQSEANMADRASVTDVAGGTGLASTPLADAEDAPTRPKISVSPPPGRVSAVSPGNPGKPSAMPKAIQTPLALSASQRAPQIRYAASPPAQVMSAQAALAAAPEQARSHMSGRIVALLGIAAVAAGALMVVRTVRAPNTAGEHIVVATAAVGASAPNNANANAAAPTPTPAADRGIDPMSLPQAGALGGKPATMAAGGHHVHRGHHVARPAAGTASTASTANAAEDDSDDSSDDAPTAAAAAPLAAAKVETATAPEAAAPKAAPAPAWLQGALGQAITKAAATPAPAADPGSAPAAASPPAAAPTPAAAPVAASGDVPQHPSQGAVTSALSGALPAARACLGPDDGVSRVRVVFGSDGGVQSLAVTGFAAGKPQEACITAALHKAHVPPFAEATYGANVNVRP